MGINMAGEIPPAPRIQKRHTRKDKNKIDRMLKKFGRNVLSLRNAFDEGVVLDDMELLLIENHFYVLQMAYLRWKRKHRPLPR